MLLKLYDRSAEGTVKAEYMKNAKKDIRTRTVIKIIHCNHCGVDFAGIWKYNCREVKAAFKRINSNRIPEKRYRLSEDLYYWCVSKNGNDDEYYDDKSYFGCSLQPSSWDSYCPDSQYSIRHYEDDDCVMLDQKCVRNVYSDISPVFKKYCTEMKNFDDMDVCPVCGAQLIKNEDVYLTSNSKDAQNAMAFGIIQAQTVSIPSKVYSDVKNGEIFKFKSNKATKCRYVKKLHESSAFKFYAEDFSDAYRYFKSYRIDEVQSAVEEKYNYIVELCNLPSSEVYSQADDIKSDTDKLRKYIGKLVEIESGIFAVCERLKTLYKLQAENMPDAKSSKYVYLYSCKEDLRIAKADYEAVCKRQPEKEVSLFDFPVEYPVYPVCPQKGDYPLRPALPIYISVNIFNKKKATAENERIKAEYETKYRYYEEQCKAIEAKYDSELAVFEKAMAEYDCTVTLIERERQRKYEARVRELESQVNVERDRLKAIVEEKQKKYDMYLAQCDSIVTPEIAKQHLIEEEITQAENLLKQLFSARNAMYDCGVIFAKYRDFVACSSFSEYLESGRCAKLDGANGAYNIYENEVRMNRVVSQLTKIIESLEQIKQNQFVIYSAINETNRLLNVLVSTMDKAVAVLGDIKADTSSISRYMEDISTNTAVSAYYSQVNAFYAKKNAELTNALGFMVAFK